jgi:hypothetical protein
MHINPDASHFTLEIILFFFILVDMGSPSFLKDNLRYPGFLAQKEGLPYNLKSNIVSIIEYGMQPFIR